MPKMSPGMKPRAAEDGQKSNTCVAKSAGQEMGEHGDAHDEEIRAQMRRFRRCCSPTARRRRARQRSLSLTLDDVFDDLFVWRQGRDELEKLRANAS